MTSQTTLRKSKLLGLRKSNLDFERNLIRIENNRRQRNKSKRTRFVPINSLARRLLSELCEKLIGHEDVNASHIYTVTTDAGLRRTVESLAVRGETHTQVPTQEFTAAIADRRKLLNLLVAGGRLELPTLGL